MSRLLRLYPAAWRARYEAEFAGMLAARPARRRDAIDIVLGAVDAHLHPELVGAAPQPWTHRLPGLLAIGAGLLWTEFFVRLLGLRPDEEWGGSVGFAVLLMFVSVPGDYAMAYLRRIGATIAAIAVATAVAWSVPWTLTDGLVNLIAGVSVWLLIGAGMLTLAAVRAGIGPRGRWALVASAVLLPAIVGIPILGGFGPGDAGGLAAMVVTALPYGLAWTFLGLRMTARGSATIVEPPPGPRITEVSAT